MMYPALSNMVVGSALLPISLRYLQRDERHPPRTIRPFLNIPADYINPHGVKIQASGSCEDVEIIHLPSFLLLRSGDPNISMSLNKPSRSLFVTRTFP